MKKLKKKTELERTNLRFNFITMVAYMIGAVILIQLFNLQILKGDSYRNSSNTNLTREARIEATRGNILDRTGSVLVSSEMTFSIEMYKTKVEDQVLNDSILLMTNILESNGDTYIDTFPISINPFEYHFNSDEELNDWKKKYKIPEAASAEEAFYIMRDKYNIKSENVKEIRQILAIRYAISTVGYSTTKSISISKNVSRTSIIQLEEQSNDLIGINIITEPVRVYNMGSFASHIIGYSSRITQKNKEEFERTGDNYNYNVDDKVGQQGIEKVFEEYLRGEDGEKQIDMSVDGVVTGEYISKEAIGGASVVLTIDANLQRVAEETLEANIMKIREGGFGKAYAARGGAAIVTNVKTGEILALASYPNFNPNDFYLGMSNDTWNAYNNDITKPLINKAVQGTYSPGSVFKMVTAIAGLETGTITGKTIVDDNGPYYIDEDTHPACWLWNEYGYGHRRLNVVGAIEKSCNYFFYDTSIKTGIDELSRYGKYFGLGRKTGVELTGEKQGTIAERSLGEKYNFVWSKGHTANASIGQGYNNFTPIQIAKYISMIANGGKSVDLTIVKNVVKSSGVQISRSEIDEFVKKKLGLEDTEEEHIDISEDNMKLIRQGMKSVTDDAGGTAYSVFRGFNIEVGGKTGSAETGKTEGSDIHAWFVGFAPYDDPEIAVTVMVENGGHGYYTAEAVRDIMAEYFGMNVQNIVEDMSVSSEMESYR